MSITPKDKAIALLRRSQKILCLSQAQSRADGMAAVLALQYWGNKMGKDVVAVLPHGVSQNLQFLPGIEQLKDDLGEPGDFVISLSTEKSDVERVKYTIEENSVDILITPKNGSFKPEDVNFRHNLAHFDLIVVLDSPNLEDLGHLFADNTELFATCPTLNITADPGATDFAKVNVVDPTKSSTCELLYDCWQADEEFAAQLDADLATVLLTGMISATGSFLRPNTTASSLEAAAALQQVGAEQSDIIEHLFKQKSFNTLKVWGRVFTNLEVDPNHRIAWSSLTLNDFKQLDTNRDDIENINDEILRYTENVDIAALMIETPQGTLAQLRSKNPNLDWSTLAKYFSLTVVENGVNIEFPESPAVAGQELLTELVHWQKERHQLDPELDIEKLTATPAPTPAATELPVKTVKKKSPVNATPPAEVPFIAPKKEPINLIPEEQTPVPGTQAAEVIIDTQQKGIPEWLKKSFPKN